MARTSGARCRGRSPGACRPGRLPIPGPGSATGAGWGSGAQGTATPRPPAAAVGGPVPAMARAVHRLRRGSSRPVSHGLFWRSWASLLPRYWGRLGTSLSRDDGRRRCPDRCPAVHRALVSDVLSWSTARTRPGLVSGRVARRTTWRTTPTGGPSTVRLGSWVCGRAAPGIVCTLVPAPAAARGQDKDTQRWPSATTPGTSTRSQTTCTSRRLASSVRPSERLDAGSRLAPAGDPPTVDVPAAHRGHRRPRSGTASRCRAQLPSAPPIAPEEGPQPRDAVRQTTSCRANPMSVSGQLHVRHRQLHVRHRQLRGRLRAASCGRRQRNQPRTVEAGTFSTPPSRDAPPRPPWPPNAVPITVAASAQRSNTLAGSSTCVRRHPRHRPRRGSKRPAPRT